MLVLAIVYSECLYEQCDELLYKVEGERRQGEQNPAVCGRVLRHLPCLTIIAFRQLAVSLIGLAAIPFIIHPIDSAVDWLFDKVPRKYCYTL